MRDTGFSLACGVLGLVCLVALALVVQRSGLRLALDYNEGWNAYHATAAIAGGRLYPAADSLFFNNYPPLSFYLVGFAAALGADLIVAGRVISLLAFLSLALTLALIVRRMGGGRAAAGFAVLSFAAPMLLFTHYVGIDDPQLLGHAVAMPAMLLLVGPLGGRRIVLAAALLVLAVFIKHNLVVLPVALLVWLALHDRRAAGLLLLSGALLGAIGLGLCGAIFGAAFLHHLLDQRGHSLTQALTSLLRWLEMGGVPLAVAVALAANGPRDRALGLCLIYAGIAFGLGVWLGGGAGVDLNIMFDANIALALISGLAIEHWPHRRSLIAPLYALPVVAWIAVNGAAGRLNLKAQAAEVHATQAAIDLLQRQPGPALCQLLALCYWAGKPPAVDVFMLTEQYNRGLRPEDELARLLRARHFGAVQLESIEPGLSRLSPALLLTLDTTYRVHHQDMLGVFLVPR